MEMDRKSLAMTALAFLAFGVATVFFVQRASENRGVECARTCETKGLVAVTAPAGTVASSVDGGRTMLEVGNDCQCIASAKTIAPTPSR